MVDSEKNNKQYTMYLYLIDSEITIYNSNIYHILSEKKITIHIFAIVPAFTIRNTLIHDIITEITINNTHIHYSF